MKRRFSIGFVKALALLAIVTAVCGQELDVPAEKLTGDKPGNMMRSYWLDQVGIAAESWRAEYEGRKTPEEIAAYQSRLRDKFLDAIGGLPERTPLEPEITGTIHRDGYRVETVSYTHLTLPTTSP